MNRLEQLILEHSKRRPPETSPFCDFHFYAHFAPNVRKPVIYSPGLVVVAQGEKTAICGGQSLKYNPQQLLMVTAPLPIECQVTKATAEEPYLAVIIPLDPGCFLDLASEMMLQATASEELSSSIAVSELNQDLRDATERVLETMLCPEKTFILGKSQLRELYYYALRSPDGHRLRAFLSQEERSHQFAQLLRSIHQSIDKTFSVEELASSVNLSVSAFHRAFKKFTLESPVQYIKRMKLHHAYSLMHYQGYSVSRCAEEVGYQSASQFSREFKRLYGESPSNLVKRAKKKS